MRRRHDIPSSTAPLSEECSYASQPRRGLDEKSRWIPAISPSHYLPITASWHIRVCRHSVKYLHGECTGCRSVTSTAQRSNQSCKPVGCKPGDTSHIGTRPLLWEYRDDQSHRTLAFPSWVRRRIIVHISPGSVRQDLSSSLRPNTSSFTSFTS